MSKFDETVRQDTPRLVVTFQRQGDKELYQWGVVGAIPVLSLIGVIVRVQAELAFRSPDECPEMALVITWDEGTHKFSWFVHQDIPVDSLVGMLETIKATIVATHVARVAASQQVVHRLLGPDGQPMRG